MSGASKLPAGFAALEPFAAYWAADSLSQRDTRRLDSTEEQRQSFYTVGKDLAPEAMDYLDGKGFADYDEADHRLMDLMLALVHVTIAVEVQREDEPIHARGGRRMPIVRERASPRHLAGNSP